MNEAPGERELLSIPIAVCGALLMVAATAMAVPAAPAGDRVQAVCMQAAPVKASCRP